MILVAIAVVATIWLGAVGKLTLYIHPRYVVFTVVMAVVALLLAVGSLLARPEHDHGDEKPRWYRLPLRAAAVAVALAVAVGLVVVPPATLTQATVDQRTINATTVGSDAQSLDSAAGQPNAAFAHFTVLDWSSLLRQTSDPAFYDGKAVDVTGFIATDADDPDNLFYVSRFVVTCCAVDAQPIGVPVYQPGWKDSFAVGAWVRVTGGFATNPSEQSSQPIALVTAITKSVKEPDEPYLF